MANARRPNATYIPLTGFGGWRWGDANLRVCVGSKIPTCWYPQRKILTPTPDARYFALQWNIGFKFALPPTPTPDASQWNIGGAGSSGVGHVYFMYISCIFHVVCASFSALATQKVADTKAESSGIWA